MSYNQALKDAVKEFQPDKAETPILFSSTEVNERGFKTLLGRKLKSIPISIIEWIIVAVVVIASVAITAILGQAGAPSFAAFVPVFIVIFLIRTTLISVSDNSIDIYFIANKFGTKKYFVYDKISLPYDKITSTKIKAGRFNTKITFVFTIDDKNYKMRTTVPNRKKHMDDHAVNLKNLIETVEKIS